MRLKKLSPLGRVYKSVIIDTMSIVFPEPLGPQTTHRSGTVGRCPCFDWSDVYSGMPRGGTTAAI
jgi:hypothetical protein